MDSWDSYTERILLGVATLLSPDLQHVHIQLTVTHQT
jgi:hypothetical protein